MIERLIALLSEHPLTTGGVLAAWAKLATFLALFYGWSPGQQEAAQQLGTDLAQLFVVLASLRSLGGHGVEMARQLFVAPPGHMIVPTAAAQIAAAKVATSSPKEGD